MKPEAFAVINFLLPGLLAAWVFHGLTAHPKREPFERIVQALTFTVVVQASVYCVHFLLRLVGDKWFALGPWTARTALIWSVALAVVMGVVFSGIANSNCLHKALYKVKLTKRTSYPGEWYSAFHQHNRYVVLHLVGERRLWGWPEEFPDQPEVGHFILQNPAWVLESGVHVPIYQTDRMLVPAKDVGMIEFEHDPASLTQSVEQIEKAQEPLKQLHKESSNGRSEAAAVPTGHPVVAQRSATDDE